MHMLFLLPMSKTLAQVLAYCRWVLVTAHVTSLLILLARVAIAIAGMKANAASCGGMYSCTLAGAFC
jgi:hypothetical protein